MLTINKSKYGVCGVDLTCELVTTAVVDDILEMRYTTYGMKIIGQNGEMIMEIQDIATNKAYVEEFIRMCMENEVSSVHILDVLEDYLI